MVTKLHAKAWLFRRPGELDTAFIGSSNLSEAALYTGLEWNVRLARADAPAVFNRIQQVFDSYWNAPVFERYGLDDRERLDAALAEAKGYAAEGFSQACAARDRQAERAAASGVRTDPDAAAPHQQRVLDTLATRRTEFDEHRHLLVAATGTGKTVIAALDYARLCEPGAPGPSCFSWRIGNRSLSRRARCFAKFCRIPRSASSSAAPRPAHQRSPCVRHGADASQQAGTSRPVGLRGDVRRRGAPRAAASWGR